MKRLKKKQNLNIETPWIDLYDEGVPKSIEYPDKMLWEFIRDSANRNPNELAYEYYGTTATFKKFMYEIEEVARSLKAIGVNKDDIVTICAPNIPQAIVSFYAVNMIGAISNMIHPLSAENEILDYLTMTKSKFMLTIDLTCEKIMNIVSKTNLEKIVVMSAADKMNKITKVAYLLSQGRKIKVPYNDDMVISWATFLDYGYMYDDSYICKKKTESEAVILFSGGTTGKPKGIVLSNLGFNAATLQTASMIQPVKPGETILTIMPIFHALGLDVCIHTPLTLGVKCILIPTFNFKKYGRLIKQYKPNYIVGVPTLLETMINDSGLQEMDLSFIKQIITGGDVVTPELKSRVDSFMKKRGSSATARPGYGLTEGSGASCLLPAVNQAEGSIGVPVQDMLYKIVDTKTHQDLPFGEKGEICISGPNVMIGYLNDKEETDKVLTKDNLGRVWLHTGDVGMIDEQGFVYFVQRLKRIIVSSGYNLYPSHIESIIMKHPKVDSVCVIGIPHIHKGQVAKAFIVLNDKNIDVEKVKKEIKRICESNLARYSIPYEFEFRNELPKTKIGKIAYTILEEENKEQK